MTDQALQKNIDRYIQDLMKTLEGFDWAPVHDLAAELVACWRDGRQVFICGNGGSGANAIHMANDLIYGVSRSFGHGLKCHALSANNAVMTCLANDEGYEKIFSFQLGILGQEGDILITLSGSGNSTNILDALRVAKEKGIKSYGILGYSGGKAKDMADTPIHFPIDDMQISEDLQMMIVHMISQWMYTQRDQLATS